MAQVLLLVLPARKRKRSTRLRRLLSRLLIGAVLLSVAVVTVLRWVPAPTSSFILQARYGGTGTVAYAWIDWWEIAPDVAIAVIAAEDQRFTEHKGFDFEQIRSALHENRSRPRPRGASTITQQVAKNLFLWSGRSYARKALEAYFTLLIEVLWPKRRILEVYLNVAQFGPRVFGVDAASRYYFGKSPMQLNAGEAALLAAVLPNPRRLKLARPSTYVRTRARQIQEQVRQLGGIKYLRGI